MSEEDDLSTAALNQEETLDLGSDQEATPAVVEDFDQNGMLLMDA